MAEREFTRRAVFGMGGAALLGSLAGCTAGIDAASDTTTSGSGYGGDSSGDGNSLADHPGAAGLESQPFQGGDPTTAEAVIVAFEDPSCPTCRRFERDTLPTLRSELLEPGRASFVFRGLGIIYDWGEPAAKALEATLTRSEAAHWALKDHFYDAQSSFDTGNVLDLAESFLDDETGVDGAAVVSDVESGAADAEYTIDMDAASAVGITATPTFLLFRDGQYVTKATGAVSYDVFATALGV